MGSIVDFLNTGGGQLLIAFVGTLGVTAYSTVKRSEWYAKNTNFVTRMISDIVFDSVAATYADTVRTFKIPKAEGESLTKNEKEFAEKSAINKIKSAAAKAGIADKLPSDEILRGKVVNAVRAIKLGHPTTKGA